VLSTIDPSSFFGGPPPEPTTDQLRRCLYTPWSDLACLLRLCQSHKPARFLEVGCHAGATTLFLSEALPDGRIVACDPGDSVLPSDRHEVQRPEYLPQHRIGELVAGRQNVTVFKCAFGRLPFMGLFDGIFIDGDHREPALREDTCRARSMLNAGGFIVWHDCGNPATPAVEPTLASLDLAIVKIEGTWIAYLETAE
jgi:predicted O-methyltransferase YrrM